METGVSKVTKQQIIDEKGGRIFESLVEESLFDVRGQGQHDKTPDYDGTISLRDGKGTYLSKHLHYQLKSQEEIKGGKFYCRRKVADYLLETNFPTILILVDVQKKKVFWYFLNKTKARAMGFPGKKKGLPINVSKHEFRRDNQPKIHAEWQRIAHESNYEKSKSALANISACFEANVRSALGILFILQKIHKDKLGKVWKNVIGIRKSEADTICEKLLDEKLIISTTNYYLVEDEKLGRECLDGLVRQLGRLGLERILDMAEDKTLMFGRLAEVSQVEARRYLQARAARLLSQVKLCRDREVVLTELGLLKKYCFRVPDVTLKIVRQVIKGSNLQMQDSVDQVSLVYNLYDEGSAEGFVLQCIELLGEIRYLHVGPIFRVLVPLCGSPNGTVREAARLAITQMAAFNMYALRAGGVFAQKTVFGEIDKWSERKVARNSGLLCEICSQVLQPSFSGQRMQDYRTMMFSRGSILPTADLLSVRDRAIRLLQRLYCLAKTVDARHSVLGALNAATQTPQTMKGGQELAAAIKQNTEEIIRFYTSIVDGAENETLRVIEKQLSRISRRFEDSGSLEELTSRIAERVEYQMYKTFVGHDADGVFHQDWRKGREIRQDRMKKIQAAITPDTFDEWSDKLEAIAVGYGRSGPGEFGYFSHFLTQLGTSKPHIALRLATEKEGEFQRFLPCILAGVWLSEERESARKILRNWIREDRKKLEIGAQVFGWKGIYDGPLIMELIVQGKATGSTVVLSAAIGKLIENFDGRDQIKKLILTAIRALTKLCNTDWVDDVWFRDEKKEFLCSLNDGEIRTVLRNLVLRSKMDYHAELLLRHIAEKRPRDVMRHLMARVQEEVRGAKQESHYRAIPYDFHEVNKALGRHANVVIAELLKWRRKREWRYRWEAEHLLQKIFPEFGVGLEQALIGLIKSRKRDVPEMVLGILGAYEGQVFVHRICKEFVKVFGDEKEYATRLFLPLSQTGGVWGTHGFVEAYEKKRKEIQPWKTDKHERVQRFALRYEEYLVKRIAEEREHADEDLNLSRRGLR
jgi:hypothetical protein